MSKELWDELLYGISQISKIKDIYDAEEEEIILGSGNKTPDIMFLGDEVDLYEDEELKVNVGSSGEFLVKLCDMAEISPERYYITTLTKSPIKYKELFEEEQEKLKELLHLQIAVLAPKIIIILGEYSAECILNRKVEFNKEKNKFFTWKGDIKVLMTYDIKYVKDARENTGKKSTVALDFWKNLQALKKELDIIDESLEKEEGDVE